MKLEKKTIALMLVSIMGLSLFVGLASAASQGNKDIVTQIMEIVFGLNTKLDEISNIAENSVQILYFNQNNYVDTQLAGADFHLTIETSKPALFTVAVDRKESYNGESSVFVFLPKMLDPNIAIIDIEAASAQNYETATFAGKMMGISAHECRFGYSVLVQGPAGTEVTIS
jgi:hypothetical protein